MKAVRHVGHHYYFPLSRRVAVALATVLYLISAYVQNSLAFSYDDIILLGEFESKVYGHQSNLPLSQRLENAEKRAFGSAQKGSETLRVRALCANVGIRSALLPKDFTTFEVSLNEELSGPAANAGTGCSTTAGSGSASSRSAGSDGASSDAVSSRSVSSRSASLDTASYTPDSDPAAVVGDGATSASNSQTMSKLQRSPSLHTNNQNNVTQSRSQPTTGAQKREVWTTAVLGEVADYSEVQTISPVESARSAPSSAEKSCSADKEAVVCTGSTGNDTGSGESGAGEPPALQLDGKQSVLQSMETSVSTVDQTVTIDHTANRSTSQIDLATKPLLSLLAVIPGTMYAVSLLVSLFLLEFIRRVLSKRRVLSQRFREGFNPSPPVDTIAFEQTSQGCPSQPANINKPSDLIQSNSGRFTRERSVIASTREGVEISLFLNKLSSCVDSATHSIEHTSFDDYKYSGEEKVSCNNFKAAIGDFTQALMLKPHDSEVYKLRGNARMAANDFAGACRDYTQALSVNSDDYDTLHKRAVSRLLLGDKLGAVEDFSQCLMLNSQYTSAYLYRGGVFQLLGQHDDACRDYTELLQHYPETCCEAYIGRSISRLHTGDLSGSIADTTRALRINPRLQAAYKIRGTARFYAGDRNGALLDLSRALRLEPTDAETYALRSQVRIALGDDNGAISDFDQTL